MGIDLEPPWAYRWGFQAALVGMEEMWHSRNKCRFPEKGLTKSVCFP